MSKLFKVNTTIDYKDDQQISDRPNSGVDQQKQNYNLIFNNAYQTLQDYFKLRMDDTDPNFLSRGILIQQDEIIASKYDQEYPFLEMYYDETTTTSYIHLYQDLYQEQESSFDDNVYIKGLLSVFDDDINNPGLLNGASFFPYYDQSLITQESDNYIIELIKFPQGGSKEYASLRVKNLYVEGDYTIVNTEEMTVEDPLLTINQNTNDPFLERNQGIYTKEQQDDSKYQKLIFDVISGSWKVLDLGYTDPVLESASHFEVGDFTCNGTFHQGSMTSDTIVFDPTFTIKDILDNIQLSIDSQTSTITFDYYTLFTNPILTQEIYGNSSQISLGQSGYNTTILQDSLLISSTSNIIDAGFIMFDYDSIEFDSTTIDLLNSIGGTDITVNIHGDINQTQGQELGNITDGQVSLLGDITIGTTGKLVDIYGSITIHDGITLSGAVSIDDLSVTNDLFITDDSTLGSSDLQNNIIRGTLTLSSASKNTNILGSLTVQEQSSFGTTVGIVGNLTQQGQTNSIGVQTSTTSILGTVNLSTQGYTTSVLGALSVSGAQTMDTLTITDISAQSLQLTNQSNTHTLLGNFALSGQQNTVTINQPTTIDNDLIINGDSTLGQDQTQVNIIRGDVTLSSVGEQVSILGNPTITGQQIFNSTVNVATMLTSYNITVTNVLRIGDIEISYDPIAEELVYTHV